MVVPRDSSIFKFVLGLRVAFKPAWMVRKIENKKRALEKVGRTRILTMSTVAAEPMTPKERTAYLNAEHVRIAKELDALYPPHSKEWYAVFDAHPTIQDWRADFHHRMNASKGW